MRATTPHTSIINQKWKCNGKTSIQQNKRALSILLVTFFIVSLTATVITANCWNEKGSLNQGNFNGNCNGNENLDSFNENNNGNNNLGFGNGNNNRNLNVGNQTYGCGDQNCWCVITLVIKQITQSVDFFTIPLHNDVIFQQACGHLLMPQVTKLML